MKTFNVVIATAGRDSLQRMVNSIAPQLMEHDYLTIIWDCQPKSLQIESKCKVISIHNPEPLGFWGHGSRNRWQDELPGDYLMNGDDDDVYTPDAMDKIRKVCTEKKLYIFQFNYSGIKIPDGKEIKVGNIGTSCGVYPKTGKLPCWEHRYGGDGEFYVALSKMLPYEHINEVIYIVRADQARQEELPPEVEQKYCECGRAMNMSYDKMLRSWKGFCHKCGT
jgi:hypothetical protein